MIRKRSDFIIVGSGLIGLITAFCLAKLGFSVTVIEKEKVLNSKNFLKRDLRTIAIAEGTKIILERYELWNKIKKFAEPIKHIKVYDKNTSAKINFKNEATSGLLGYIIESKLIKKILFKEIKILKKITIIDGAHIKKISYSEENVLIKTDKNLFCAPLLVAADGKNSFVRKTLNHYCFSKNYNQYAIVINFLHSKDHNNIAYEMFFDSGPLATLPMLKNYKNYHSSSLVWSHRPDYIKYLDKINDSLLMAIIDDRIENILGKTVKILGKQYFPLSAHINSKFTSKRAVFIGDAAHSIHPIAGQGWNVGIRDVSKLLKIIVEARTLGLDIGSEYVCKNYQNQRYFDAFSFYQITDKLNSFFMLQNYGTKLLRQAGFNIINHSKIIKSIISNYAMGLE